MKKLTFIYIAALLVICGCEKDSEISNHIAINGKNYDLNTGYIQNMSWQEDSEGTFKITLASSSENPETYFTFRLLSPSKSSVSSGEYSYAWWPDNTFLFLFPEIETFDGLNLTEENYSWSGSIKVEDNGNKQSFIINITVTDDITNQEIAIKGNFSDSLTEIN